MAYNVSLAQAITQSENALFTGAITKGVGVVSTGTEVFSLSSQLLEKTQMYLSGSWMEPNINKGINGFLMDVVKETTVDLQSEITDYPLETEERIQSHYSKHPVKIKISGICSDIRAHDPNDNVEQLLDDLTEMSEKLTRIAGNLGVGKAVKNGTRITSYMNATHILYRKIKETANRLSKVYNILSGREDTRDLKSSQINAFEQLENMWSTGALLNVETPYKVYKKCVIENLSFTQPENTFQQTMIEVTLKQLTTTDVSTGFYKAITDEKTFIQLAEIERKNNANGESESFLKGTYIDRYNEEKKSGENGAATRAMEKHLAEKKLSSAKQVSSRAIE